MDCAGDYFRMGHFSGSKLLAASRLGTKSWLPMLRKTCVNFTYHSYGACKFSVCNMWILNLHSCCHCLLLFICITASAVHVSYALWDASVLYRVFPVGLRIDVVKGQMSMSNALGRAVQLEWCRELLLRQDCLNLHRMNWVSSFPGCHWASFSVLSVFNNEMLHFAIWKEF